MEKIDRLNAEVLHKKTNFQASTMKDHYLQGHSPSEGFCTQWTAAALDKSINEFINRIGDLKCGDVTLSKGEVKELFTRFYLFGTGNLASDLYGGNYPRNFTDDVKAFLKYSGGLDKMDAALFDQQLTDGIASDQGIGISVVPNGVDHFTGQRWQAGARFIARRATRASAL
jgi:hypothetical protein